jgi:hypothetical protein
MADAMIGFGIGLTGTPKDYTSIVAARQRQKQLGELEEKKKKQAMNEDILKSISVPSGLVMDYRTKEMEQATANFVREAQDAIEKQDINTLAQLKQQYKMLWDQRVAERKVYDEDLKNYETGKTVYRRDPRLLVQAKTPEEALKLSQEYPDSFYSSDYGNVTLKPISRLDLTQIYKRTASDLPVTRIEKTTKDAQGRRITIFEDQIQAPVLEARLRADYTQDPLIRSNVEINYTGDLSGLTLEQKDKVLQDVFVKNGMDWAGKSGYKILGGRGGLTLNFGTGSDTLGIGDIQESDIEVGFQPQTRDSPLVTETVTRSKGYAIPEFKATVTQTSNLRSMDTGEKINNSAVSEFQIGEFRLVPTYKTDKRGLNIKGKIISDKMRNSENAKDNIEWKVIATGTGEIYQIDPNTKAVVSDENGRPIKNVVRIYRDAKEVAGSLAGKLNKNQYARHDANYRQLQREADELNGKKAPTITPSQPSKTNQPAKTVVVDEFEQFKRNK